MYRSTKVCTVQCYIYQLINQNVIADPIRHGWRRCVERRKGIYKTKKTLQL